MSFGTGLHIMLALAYNPGVRLSSTALASSIDANPVTIRRVISELTDPTQEPHAWVNPKLAARSVAVDTWK